MREEELKFAVHALFGLPDLTAVAGGATRVRSLGRRRLEAVYHDTSDLRLARAGITLRHRTGEDGPPWHLKLPSGAVNVREELGAEGPPDAPPRALTALVTAWVRGAALAPVATLHTDRDTHLLLDDADTVLAEVVDDTVSVLDGRRLLSRFREVEVERRDAPDGVLEAIGAALVAAGAVGGEFTPKLMRVLGPRSSAPPDVSAPGKLSSMASAGEAVAYALRRTARRLLDHDVRVRRDEPDAVHQMRVACRRMRSDLGTYRSLVDPEWVAPLVEELRWLADALGGVRDAEVQRARLRRTAAADPLAPLDADAVDRVDAALAAREEAARVALAEALDSDRYVALLDTVVDAAQAPRLVEPASQPAVYVLPPLVGKAWRGLASRAGALEAEAPDEVWHRARIRAKRARYAAEAAAPLLGKDAVTLGAAAESVQEVLGEHQDAAVSAEVWLEVADGARDDAVLVLTCGRLVERERASVRAARAAFGDVWSAADRRRNTRWLSR